MIGVKAADLPNVSPQIYTTTLQRQWKAGDYPQESLCAANNTHPSKSFCTYHTCPLCQSIVGVGKERDKKNDQSGFLSRQHLLLELRRGLQTLCWRLLGSERHRYAIAWQHLLLDLRCGPLALCWRPLGSERHRYAIE